MEAIVNLGTNPSAEVGVADWLPQACSIEQSGEWAASGKKSFKLYDGSTTSSDMRRGSAGSFPFGMEPGRTYSVSAVMRLAKPMEAVTNVRARRLSILYSTNSSTYTFAYGTQGPNVAGTFRSVATATIPENATGILIMFGFGSSIKEDEIWWDAISIVESPVPVEYFDGDSGRVAIPGSVDWYVHRWLGTPGMSASVRERMSVSEWTRRWWGSLPHAYQAADNAQEVPGMSNNPLLRFMDGPGRVAGQMRDISDQAWAGDLTNPATTPDNALPWLAQMLGTPTTVRELPREQLRTYLQDMATDGRPPAGTRQSIITAAKQFLIGEGQALIQPTGPTTPAHTIVMLVRADQVPAGDLPALVAKVRATGVIPAGHILSIRMAVTEWDTWEAEAGLTWDEVDANTRTWAVADSLGIQLEALEDP